MTDFERGMSSRPKEHPPRASPINLVGEAGRVEPPRSPVADRLLLLLLGGTLGTSALWGGLYSISVWGPVTLFVMALTLAALVTRPGRLSRTGLTILSGLAAMAALSAVSILWAESTDRALVETHRWALYAGIFLTAALLTRDEAAKRWLLSAMTAGVVLVCALILARMLAGDGDGFFYDFRLTEPLGYVNGQAGFFLLAFWPLFAVMEGAQRSMLRSAVAGIASSVACLLYLTQSRGAAAALVTTALVLLAVVPGRPWRLLMLLVVGGSVALVSAQLGDVYAGFSEGRMELSDATLRGAAAAAIVAGLISALGVAVLELARRQGVQRWPRAVVISSRVGLIVLVLSVVGVLAANAVQIADELDEQVGNFQTGAAATTERSRLLTGGGNRYDYWRVALKEFADEPILGLGAGNYTPRYFQLRRSTEDVRQPHSLVLQTMAELGVLGSLALLAWVAAGLRGFFRASRKAATASERALAIAAGGVFVGWLLHTNVDWLHLLPGVAGAAIAALATVAGGSQAGPALTPRPRLAIVLGAVVCVLVVCVGVGRLTLAAHYRAQGQDALREHPRRALELTADSLSLNGEALETFYLRAAVFARLGRYEDARAALSEAVRLEPRNFVPEALLGDLAVRRRDFRTAQSNYRRAFALNPRDRTLGRFARNPKAALSLERGELR